MAPTGRRRRQPQRGAAHGAAQRSAARRRPVEHGSLREKVALALPGLKPLL